MATNEKLADLCGRSCQNHFVLSPLLLTEVTGFL